MPVKVRCACGAGISAPDAARGKVIKCRKCGEPVRVPRGKSSGEGRPKRKKAAGPKPSVHDDDFFSRLDLDGGEDLDIRICPKCAAEVDEEDIECPHCGVHLETGVLSAKQKKKRKRKGPDPDDFPKAVWKKSMDFLKQNKSLGFRLSLVFSVTLTIFLASLYMATVYCIPEDPTNPETPIKIPVIAFWGFIATLSGSASTGCFWQLFVLVVKATMDQRDSLDRFNFDFFTGVALGFKLFLWPLALTWPLMSVVWGVGYAMLVGVAMRADGADEQSLMMLVVAALVGSFVVMVASAIVYVLPMWMFPVAMSHMSARYTYRAYIPYDMYRFAFRSFKGVCVWWLVAFCSMLPALAVLIPIGIYAQRIYTEFGSLLTRLVGLCGVATEVESRGFMFDLTAGAIALPLIALLSFVVAMLMAFPSVFLMRATGLFSYYNQRELGLGDRRKENEPAGFWVRYLQYTIDGLLVSIFSFMKFLMLLGIAMACIYLEMDGMIPTIDKVDVLLSLLIPIVYFTFTESSPGRGTLGMNALGLEVVNEDGTSPISKGKAFGRYFGRITLIIGAFTMLKDPEQRTLHDKMSKTRVMWRKLNQ